MSIIIYTDGSAKGNPGIGGYGIVMMGGGYRKELKQGFRLTTNNRMELLAVIIALESHDIGKPRGLVSQVFDKSRRLFISDTEKSGIPEDSLTSHGVSFISHECCNVSKDLYKINVKANRKVFTWTVCDKDMALRVRDNCDNITFEGFMP